MEIRDRARALSMRLSFALLPAAIAMAFAAEHTSGTKLETSAMPGVLAYTASPATAETRLTLRGQAGRIVIMDDFTGEIMASGRADRTRHVIVRGVDGNHNDTLTVDCSGGLSLPGGIDFDGGMAGFDTLRMVGEKDAASRHVPINGSDGAIELGATEIRYRNLEPVVDTVPSVSFTINLPAGTQGASLQDNGGQAELSSTTTPAGFESITFANKSAVTIIGGGGADTVTLAANVWADLAGVPVTVTGSGSSNTLIVDLTGATNPSLPVSDNTGNLSGAWTFGNRPSLTFSGIQSLNPADVSVSNSGPGSATVGSPISYTITASNAGPNWAAGVTVSDVLPANTTLVSAAPSQGSCSGTATVACSLGVLGPGASATITLVLAVNSGTSVSDAATVTTATTDPNPANNSSTSVATLVSVPSLATWGLVLLAALLAACGAFSLKRATAR